MPPPLEKAIIAGLLALAAAGSPIGIEPRPTTPEEFDRLLRDEIALFTKTARAANIRAD